MQENVKMPYGSSDALRSAAAELDAASSERKHKLSTLLRAVGMALLAMASVGGMSAGTDVRTLLTLALYSATTLLLASLIGDTDAYPLVRRREVSSAVTEHWRDFTGSDLVTLVRPRSMFERSLDVSAATLARLDRGVRRHLDELGYPAGQVSEAVQLGRKDGGLTVPELLKRAARR